MQQKSNRASIIVAILAFALILGAVFLLNQTFRNRSESRTSTSSSSSSSSSESSEEESSSSFSISSFNDDDTENPDTSSSSSALTSSSATSGSSSSIDVGELSDGQAVIRVLSVTGSQYQIETINSQGIQSRFFAPGAKTRVNLTGATMEQGKSYRVEISARDTSAGFALDRFLIIGEV